jgi:predicted aspartyl protease
MGQVFTNITLKNATDVINVERGLITAPEVRETAVRAMADTGAGTLVINEWVRAKLGLKVLGLKRATLANNQREVCKVTEPVEVHWNDRSMSCRALVIADQGSVGDGTVLLGAIPLEDMDLIVNPVTQQVEGAHGDEAIALIL